MQKVKNLSNLSFRLRVHCNNPSLDTLYLFINRRIIKEIVANGAIGRTLLVIIYIYIYIRSNIHAIVVQHRQYLYSLSLKIKQICYYLSMYY
jgi:hypothetical protein